MSWANTRSQKRHEDLQQLGETTRISDTMRYVDALLGKERPIGTREMAMFTTKELTKAALKNGGGLSAAVSDMFTAKAPVYEAIETLRLRPEEARNRRIFWGMPEYFNAR